MAGEFSSNNILVEKLLSTDVPKLYYDEWGISQVFINLFRNAIHAMNSKGTLFLSSYVYYDTVKIEIEDTGSGIPEDMFENIFDPFFTTKS
jgi:signal transduction histidine kinase